MGLTNLERQHRFRRRRWRDATVEAFNEIARLLSRGDVERFEASGIFPIPFLAAIEEQMEAIRQQRRDWQIATGREFVPDDLLALEAMRHDTIASRRERTDWKPNKSPTHDEPWPDAPVNWAPRRWFRGDVIKALRRLFPGIPLNPLQISVSRALNQERALIRAKLATEVKAPITNDEVDWGSEPIAERNHPKPQGFWSVAGHSIADLNWKIVDGSPIPMKSLRRACCFKSTTGLVLERGRLRVWSDPPMSYQPRENELRDWAADCCGATTQMTDGSVHGN